MMRLLHVLNHEFAGFRREVAKSEDAAAALQKLGGADVILATAPSGSAIGSLLPGLAVRGKLVVLIAPPDVAIEHLFPPHTEEKVKALSQCFEY